MKRLASLMSVAFLLLPLAQNGLSAEKIRFATSIKGVPAQELPMIVAEEQGFWKKHRLEVDFVSLRSGADLHRSLAASAVDLGNNPAVSTVQAIARDLPIVAVADFKFKYNFIIYVNKESHLKEPRDLKGARIGIPRLGGAAYAYGQIVAKSLDLVRDMKLVAVGGNVEMLAAIRARSIDGGIISTMATAHLLARQEGRPLLSLLDYLPKDWTDLLLVGRSDFLEKNPEPARRAILAYQEATNFIMDSPQWAMGRMKSFYGYADETAKLVYGELRFSRDGRINRKALENVINFSRDYGIVPKDKVPALERLYTEKFAR